MASMVAVLVLLVVMVALILRPFVFPAPENNPVPAIDVRQQVEAAIAARKATLAPVSQGRVCVSCSAAAEPEDSFCRKCGSKLL